MPANLKRLGVSRQRPGSKRLLDRLHQQDHAPCALETTHRRALHAAGEALSPAIGRLYRHFVESVAAIETFLDRIRQLRQRQPDVESEQRLAERLVGLKAPQVDGAPVP